MKQSARHLISIAALCLASAACAAETEPLLPDSTVEVLVTSQRPDAHFPWRRERPGSRQGYGVFVSPTHVITTDELVRNATLIEVRQPGRGRKWTARLIQADARANAAVLDVANLPPDAPFKPARLDDAVPRAEKVQVVTFDEAGQMKSGDGRITEASVEALPDAASSILLFKVLTDLKTDGQGLPVFHHGRLAGLVMEYDSDTQSSVVIPSPILRQVVEDAASPPYKGLASAGLLWTALVDPAKRRYFKLQDDNRGILVTRLLPGSGASHSLRPGDVIVSWDSKPIDSQGYYPDEVYGRLLLTHLICGRRRPGDIVPVSIVRDGAALDVQVTLSAYNDREALVPRNPEDEPADYLVDGGLVLRELSFDYLRSFGAKWMVNANPRLVNLYLTRALAPDKPGQRVVILSAVLPDPINIGYQGYRDEIVTKVNGQPVANLDEVFAIVSRDGGVRRLAFDTTTLDLVLDPTGLSEANRRLAQQYRIPHLMSHRTGH